MSESMKSRAMRYGFNLFPCWRGTGARVTYVAGDYREMRVKLPLNLRTRNYVGTIFGGSMYAACDPPYMIMLLKNLGDRYIVWDKAASIRFRKPGRTTLRAKFVITQEDIDAICTEAENAKSIDKVFRVDLVDDAGVVHAEIEKVIYIKKKSSS